MDFSEQNEYFKRMRTEKRRAEKAKKKAAKDAEFLEKQKAGLEIKQLCDYYGEKACGRRYEFLVKRMRADIGEQYPNWYKTCETLTWQNVKHIITGNLEFGEQYVRWKYPKIIASCACGPAEQITHHHFIVEWPHEEDRVEREREKRRFWKEVHGKTVREIPSGKKIIDNIITPRCPVHALNMLQYVHRPDGQSGKHKHKNPVAGYEDVPNQIDRLAIGFRAMASELAHIYPPIIFDTAGNTYETDRRPGFEVVCHCQKYSRFSDPKFRNGSEYDDLS